jgi:hypothetical protein
MEELAFATKTAPDTYQIHYAASAEELYREARRLMPLRDRYNAYLAEALASEAGIKIMTAPEPEEDYLEVILGRSRPLLQYLTEGHIAYLQQQNGFLRKAADTAQSILRRIAGGTITPGQLNGIIRGLDARNEPSPE